MRDRTATKYAKNGEEIEVIDLVNLCLTDMREFRKLFEQGQGVLNDSLPGEIEPDEKVFGYIEEAAQKLGLPGKIGRYNYMVLAVNDSVKAVTCFGLMSEGTALINHWETVAVQRDARGLGLSQIVTDAVVERTNQYSVREHLNPLGLIGDVNLFDKPEDVDKYKGRLKFHHNVIGFGAAVIIEDDDTVRLVPHSSPAIRRTGQDAQERPYILAIAPYVDGQLRKIAVDQGSVIGPNGKIIGDKGRLHVMAPDAIRTIVKLVCDNYREDLETYDPKQIDHIEESAGRILERAKAVHLIPIYDTRFLQH
ncbi:MAG TPA: hypothetical protein VJA47_03755 [archaeon]|nr:hypothetical protein [archaeon]